MNIFVFPDYNLNGPWIRKTASQRLLLFARDGPFSQAWSGFRFNCNIDIHYDDTSPTWFNAILEDLPLLTISNHHYSEVAVKSL